MKILSQPLPRRISLSHPVAGKVPEKETLDRLEFSSPAQGRAWGWACSSLTIGLAVAISLARMPALGAENYPAPYQLPEATNVEAVQPEVIREAANDPSKQTLERRLQSLERWLRQDYPDASQSLEWAQFNRSLLELDQQGRSTLSYLEQIRHQGVAEGLNGRSIVNELLQVLGANQGLQQNNRATCGPTSVGYLHAQEDPADYARVIAGLVSPQGTASLKNGQVIQRNPTSLEPDNSKRFTIDRLYQASLQDAFNGPEGYDNERDENFLVGGQPRHLQGMTGAELARSLTAIRDLAHRYQAYLGDPAATDQLLKERLSQGQRVVVMLRWNPESQGGPHRRHFVVLEALGDDSLLARNPWGSQERGQGGPSREVRDRQGRFAIARAEFYSRLDGIILPDIIEQPSQTLMAQ